ncbi:plasmid partitioning protein RepB, partial [Rhizobium sp. BR5]
TAPERSRPRVRPILGSPELVTDVLNSPVGMIGQSLNEVSERAKRAEEIEKQLAEGLTIVSLNPADIDPSFIPDRMPSSEEADAGLVEAIREQGQQVPILVRPHPDFPGRYQVAFGHRRLRAVSRLGIPVKAVVRDLSDEQLVVAQGQENNERRDLTYIEKARFAQKLQMRFPRDTIMAAMSLYKGDLSNMLSVVGRIPEDLVDLIGPAPTVGRRNWMDLADQLSSSQVKEAARAYVR